MPEGNQIAKNQNKKKQKGHMELENLITMTNYDKL